MMSAMVSGSVLIGIAESWVGTAASWMLTYLIHSTIAILAVWLLVRGIKPIAARISPSAENLGWKLALVGAFVTATVQIAAGVRPALGALEFESGAKVVEHEQVRPELVFVPASEPVVIDESEVMMLGTRPVPAAAESPAEPEPAPLWPKLVLLAWAIGATLAGVRLLLCARTLRRRLKDRGPVLEDPVLESFLTLCRDAEVSRQIKLTQSDRIASPIALWRREIVVPERAVAELSPAAMRSVLAHELAHLIRRDPFWLVFAAVIEAVCFFQPLNRLARRGMQESAELLCDDWAIAHTGDGVVFAKSLAEVATWENANRSSLLLAGMISGEGPLVRRVRRALDGDPRRFESDASPRPTRMLVGVGSLAALIMFAPTVVDASPPNRAESPSKRELRERKRAHKAAEKARREAEKARARAEAAEREAQRLAEEARRAGAAPPVAPEPPPAPSGSHLIIRDGDEYLIIDENGMRLRSKDADIDVIDGQNPRMRMRVREGEQEIDLDIDLEAITGMALEMLGEEMLGDSGLGADEFERIGGGLGGFGVDEEALERELEALGRELEEQVLRELGEGFGGNWAPAPPPAAPPAPPAPPAAPPVEPAPPTLI